MTSSTIKENPFAVLTPEDMPANDVLELFVDVFTDYYNVPKQGHTFLNGPRGSGKSMMFRFMLPDCQTAYHQKSISELDYFAIYIPIKKTSINYVDLNRLEKHANILFNEHLLTTYISAIIFNSLSKYFSTQSEFGAQYSAELECFYENKFRELLVDCGYREDLRPLKAGMTAEKIVLKMQKVCDSIYKRAMSYVKKFTFNPVTGGNTNYNDPLCSYLEFLLPLLENLKNISFFPKAPVFLLIDDADNLNNVQKEILNTWVSYRTTGVVSLKISTQLRYNTFRTVSGLTIDSSHDYTEVNIATVYTSDKNKYRNRVKSIVEKRLKSAGIAVSAEEFFPQKHEQETQIREIYNRIKENYPDHGRGYRASDDAYRYAIPDYIKELKNKKSGSTYSYSGFVQLVNISSGVVRFFLEPASQMYSEQVSLEPNSNPKIQCVTPSIQDKIIREYSDRFMFSDFDRIKEDYEKRENGDFKTILSLPEKMRNLITGMGGLFHEILTSDFSERRIFSVALTDYPRGELYDVLKMAIQNGYLTESSIGDKDRMGRSPLYILNRRLAPYFFLDPSSYSGYKFMPSKTLEIALLNPKSFISKVIKDTRKTGKNMTDKQKQLPFDEGDEE